MRFLENHKLHFVVTIMLIVFCSSFLFLHFEKTRNISIDSNRIATARLLNTAIETYKTEFKIYPEKLEDLLNFINPVPVDIKTQKQFEYIKTDTWFKLVIPQSLKEEFIFQK